MNSDFKDLLSLFNRYNVRYLVVGGYAVMYYTEPRYTKDLDLVIGRGPGEVQGVATALSEFGFQMSEENLAQLHLPNQMIALGRPPVRIDILNEISGVDFDSCWQRRVQVDIGGVTAWFIAKDDLIAAKRASGRSQDLRDLEALEEADELDRPERP